MNLRRRKFMQKRAQRGFISLINPYGNFASSSSAVTWSTTDKTGGMVLTNGNLTWTESTGESEAIRSTVGKSSNKWYWEVTVTSTQDGAVGIRLGSDAINSAVSAGTTVSFRSTGTVFSSGGMTINSGNKPSASYSNGDVLMFALDMDVGKLWIGRNGSWASGADPTAGTNPLAESLPAGTYYAYCWTDNQGGTTSHILNAGTTGFLYAPPNNFSSLSPSPFDAQFAYVTLLVLGDNGAGSTTFVDRSPLANAITRNVTGAFPQNASSPALMGAGSIEFGGGGIEVASGLAAAWDFGSGDFTLEFVGQPASGGTDRHFFDVWNQRFLFRHSGGTIQFYTDFSSPLFSVSQAWPTSGTHYWTVARSGSNWGLWYDGVSLATASNASAISSTAARLRVSNNVSGDTVPGYGVVRVTKGFCRYTPGSNYNLPTAFQTTTPNGSLSFWNDADASVDWGVHTGKFVAQQFSTGLKSIRGFKGVLSGQKRVWATKTTARTNTTDLYTGVTNASQSINSIGSPYWLVQENGTVYSAGGTSGGSSVTAPSVNDIKMWAYDYDAKKLWYGLNGTWAFSGDPAAGTGPAMTFTTADEFRPLLQSQSQATVQMLVGSDYPYSVPSGFSSL